MALLYLDGKLLVDSNNKVLATDIAPTGWTVSLKDGFTPTHTITKIKALNAEDQPTVMWEGSIQEASVDNTFKLEADQSFSQYETYGFKAVGKDKQSGERKEIELQYTCPENVQSITFTLADYFDMSDSSIVINDFVKF